MEATPTDSVRMLLKRPAVEVILQQPLRAAAETLAEELIGVGIVRGTRPPALLSERDVVAALAVGADPDQARVEDVMTDDVVELDPRDTILDAASRMLDNEIRHLPVVEDGVVIGVVSERDLLRVLTDYARKGGEHEHERDRSA
jgi:signal-transduction protein with cAMP-binding, CBS, and nucleotidyltransferase domain